MLFFFTCVGFAQNNYIVKTEDGRRVLLKADYTWEYIDAEVSIAGKGGLDLAKTVNESACDMGADFEEPKLDNKIQAQLKKGRATMGHVKEKVAHDYNCTIADVVLLDYKEQKSKGVYVFCANGTKVAYKRTGHTIIKKGKI